MTAGQSKKISPSRSMAQIKACQERHANGFVSAGSRIPALLEQQEKEAKERIQENVRWRPYFIYKRLMWICALGCAVCLIKGVAQSGRSQSDSYIGSGVMAGIGAAALGAAARLKGQKIRSHEKKLQAYKEAGYNVVSR